MTYSKNGLDKTQFITKTVKFLSTVDHIPHKQALVIAYNLWEKQNKHYKLHNESCFISYESMQTMINSYSNIEDNLINEIIAAPVLTAAVLAPKLISGASKLLDIPSDKIPIDPSTLISKDQASTANKIKKPQGIILEDTYNNLFFPIPIPQIDNSKFSLPDIKQQYQAKYSKLDTDYLPWHFIIEMLHGNYYVFNTRPIDVQYPLSNIQAKEYIDNNKVELNPISKKFFLEQPFDLRDSIHICIVGDTNKDVYTMDLYAIIGRICAGPILRYFKLSANVGHKLIGLNIGQKFHMSQLDFYLKR